MTAQVTVGLDGSREGFAAAAWAACEAVLREVPPHLVHVEAGPVIPALSYPIAAYRAKRSAGPPERARARLRIPGGGASGGGTLPGPSACAIVADPGIGETGGGRIAYALADWSGPCTRGTRTFTSSKRPSSEPPE